MKAKYRGLYWRMLRIKVRLQIVQKMAYIALQTCEKYQYNLNSIITVRVEMKLTKTGLFVHKNREQRISLQVKFSLHSEISLCSKFSSL